MPLRHVLLVTASEQSMSIRQLVSPILPATVGSQNNGRSYVYKVQTLNISLRKIIDTFGELFWTNDEKAKGRILSVVNFGTKVVYFCTNYCVNNFFHSMLR